MNDSLLDRLGRMALMALTGALVMFGSELAGLLPELSGLNTIIVTGLIGLVSFLVEKLRDLVNQNQGGRFTIEQVDLIGRIGRAALVALLGGLAILAAGVADLLPELSGIVQIVMSIAAGMLSMLIEYLRDLFDLPAQTA